MHVDWTGSMDSMVIVLPPNVTMSIHNDHIVFFTSRAKSGVGVAFVQAQL